MDPGCLALGSSELERRRGPWIWSGTEVHGSVVAPIYALRPHLEPEGKDEEMLVERMRKVWRLGWWRDARNGSEGSRWRWSCINTTFDWFEGGDRGGVVISGITSR